jgi:hypothetical protein
MPSISNLPPVLTFTGTMIFPVVDVDPNPDITKKASFSQLRSYILDAVLINTVAGRTGDVVLTYSDIGGLSTVAHSGNYNDLSNRLTFATVSTSGSYTDLSDKPVLFSGDYRDLSNIPSFSAVATTGDYADLQNKPTLFSGSYINLTNKPAFATVSTSGSYTDLSNKPSIPTSILNLGISDGTTGSVLTTNGSGVFSFQTVSGGGGGGSATLSGLTDVLIGSVSNGQVLKYSSSAGKWINGTDNTGGGGGGGLTSRVTATVTSASLNPGSSGTYIISGFKSYALISIKTSTASWVTLYSSVAARTTDSTRPITQDPLAGSGVIAEIITITQGTQYFSPALIGYSSEDTPVEDIPVKIYNNSLNTATISVTLTLIQLEV